MVTTTTNELTITKSGISPVKILLLGDKSIKWGFDKGLLIIDVPKQATPFSWLVDLKKLKEVITVTGILEDEATDSHYAKKARMRQILQSEGTMTIQWDSNDTNQPYTVNIIKGEVAESPGTFEQSSDTKYFDITIQFAIGLNKG